MRIGVIGGGVVGRATARSFVEHVDEVRVFDVVEERRTHQRDNVLACDLIFLCLPTPQREGSLSCDTSILESQLSYLATSDHHHKNFVLRSTVPIGFTKRMAAEHRLPNLVHSPEFLTARCSVVDAQMPARNIVGVPGTLNECGRLLCDLYKERFPGVPVYGMSSDESEAVKLFLNGFFAVKVAYWNEVHCLARKLGLDWGRVMEGVLSDGRVSPSHTRVPGPDGRYGFGGACLPKDLANLIDCLDRNGLMAMVTAAANTRNLLDREGR